MCYCHLFFVYYITGHKLPAKCEWHCVVLITIRYNVLHVYLPTLTHDAWVSCLHVENIDLVHRANFSCLTHKSRPLDIQVPQLCIKWRYMSSSKLCPNANYLNIFGHLRQCSEIVGTSSEIQILWRWKSHRFGLGKVGRHKIQCS